MALTIRTITDDEVPAFRTALMQAFGEDADDADPDGTPRFRALIAPGHAWAAFDGDAIVGTAATFDHAIGVPGGATLPMAGLTMVSVRPTHRRRGILRELMALHLADARRRGFAVSGLWASEASIYRRFGYGLAAFHDVLEIANAGIVRFADDTPGDEIEAIDEARAREQLPAVYARATTARPGALRRDATWWRERRFLESPLMRRGASRRRHIIAKRGGELVGYAVYRQRPKFTTGLPDGRIELSELFGVDRRAEQSLWRFALSIDLFPNVSWWCAPVDCTLPWLLEDPRRVSRQRMDNLWLRIEDVPAVLQARGYARDGRLRFAVAGTAWDLAVEGGVGRCTPATGDPQLVCDGPTLGAMVLGGTSASALAAAELVRGDVTAIALADCLFGSVVAPWCPEIF